MERCTILVFNRKAMFRLLRYFSVTSLVAFVIVAILLGVYYHRMAVDQLVSLAESKNVALTQAFSNSLWPEFAGLMTTSEHLSATELRAHPEITQLDQAVRRQMGDTEVVKVKVYAMDGWTVFSTEPGQIGEDKGDNLGFQTAIRGQVASELTHRDTFSAFEGKIANRDLLATYIPVRVAGGDGMVEAVFELYSDVTPLMNRIDIVQRQVVGGVSLILGVLWVVLFLIVRRADGILHRQQAEMQEVTLALQQAKDQLEARVEARTAELRRLSEQLQEQLVERQQREIEREGLLVSEREQRKLAETLGRVGLALSATLDLDVLLNLIARESTGLFGADSAFVWLVEGEGLVGFAGFGPGLEVFAGMRVSLDDPSTLGCRVVLEKRPMYVNHAAQSDQVNSQLTELFHIQSILGVPLIKGERAVGALMIMDLVDPDHFCDQDIESAVVLGSQAAIAIEQARLFEETQRQLDRLNALRTIDITINASLDLRVTLNVILEQVIRSLGVDAAAVWLLKPRAHTLERAARKGFHTGSLLPTQVRLGQGPAGLAALERRTVSLPDLSDPQAALPTSEVALADRFEAYFGVPLLAKGQVKGVLEVFHRQSLSPDAEWLEFLETLAGQAAIAIDNALLFNDLQRSNTELTLAYDATIEGWARALELRDMETKGHSQRVTDWADRLARAVGVSGLDLVHLRRGALLHDIGKMGVPDSILHKPGPLSEAEWAIMRQHPVFAHEMLSPIPYLRSALEIPYSHHERWDGSGYPMGLKGEEIPLAARIFAIVDVWDALLSERPYRAAWRDEDVIAYLQEQCGKQFDPHILPVFIELLAEREAVAAGMPPDLVKN